MSISQLFTATVANIDPVALAPSYIGSKSELERFQDGPRFVWIPTTATFMPPGAKGPNIEQQWAKRLYTTQEMFEVHIWAIGQSIDAQTYRLEAYTAAETMRDTLLSALRIATGTNLVPDSYEWYNPGDTDRGVALVLRFSSMMTILERDLTGALSNAPTRIVTVTKFDIEGADPRDSILQAGESGDTTGFIPQNTPQNLG